MGGENNVQVAERDRELETRLLDVFDEQSSAAVSTQTVADEAGADTTTVRRALERLADGNAIEKVDLEGQYVGWERPPETFVGHAKPGSYRISDEKTGLVTRGDSRASALRRLADRIELLESGTHVGSQILGVCDAVISPEYFDGVEDVLESYVRPENRHLYVFVEDDGVTEIETAAELTRETSILGFTVTGVFDRDEFSDVMIVSADRVIETTKLRADHFPVGVFKVTAVHPDHQQEGVGTALASHGLAYLAETPPVLTMLWQRDDDSNERLAGKFGAEKLAAYESATPLDRQCPQCGFDVECSCMSVLYGWGIDDVEG